MTGTSNQPPAAPTIGSVLRQPGVLTTFALNMLAKLPLAAIGLLLLIRVSEEYGYAAAGVVDAIFAIGLGVAGAVWGRAVQHVPMARVVLPLSIANGLVIATVGLLPSDAPFVVFAAAGLLIGLTEPPFGGVMRVLWDRLLAGDDERHVGYSIDGALSEAAFAVGPALLIGAVASFAGPDAALVTCGAVIAAAGIAFACAPAVRATPANAADERSTGILGALRHPGVRTAVLSCIAIGAHFGPIEVGITAFGREHGGDGTVGLLFGLWASGSAAAGLWLARVGPAPDPVRRMVAVVLWTAACTATLAIPSSSVVLAVPLLLAGIGIAPFYITLNGAFDRLAPRGAEAEIFNVTMAGMMAGIVVGTPLAGLLVDAGGHRAGFLLGVAGPILAATILIIRRQDFAQKT